MDTETTPDVSTLAPGSTGNFAVKTDQFEGPLELLLSLIESRKMLISDISLARVADDFIAHVRAFPAFPIAEVANFVLVASTLLLIKSKSLLPTLDLSKEEEGNIADLKDRLALFELFRARAAALRPLWGRARLFARRAPSAPVRVFAPESHCTQEELAIAMERVILALPATRAPLPQISIRKVMSLEEMIGNLAERVSSALRLSFREFAGRAHGPVVSKEEREHIVVGFLALLELVKRGAVLADQDEPYADIAIETTEFSTPNYGQ